MKPCLWPLVAACLSPLPGAEQPSPLDRMGFQPKTLALCIEFKNNKNDRRDKLRAAFKAQLGSIPKPEQDQGVFPGVKLLGDCDKGSWPFEVSQTDQDKKMWLLRLMPPAGAMPAFSEYMNFGSDDDVLSDTNRDKFAAAIRGSLTMRLQNDADLRLKVYQVLYAIKQDAAAPYVAGRCRNCVILPLDVREFGLFLRSKFQADYKSPDDEGPADLKAFGQYCVYEEGHQGPLAKTQMQIPAVDPKLLWSNLKLSEFNDAAPISPCDDTGTVTPVPAPLPPDASSRVAAAGTGGPH